MSFDFFFAYHKTSLDLLFNFYVAYHSVNNTDAVFDHQITITNAIDDISSETMDQQNEFILLDLQCQQSLDILMNAGKQLENNYWIILNMNETMQVRIFEVYASNAFQSFEIFN